MTSQDVIHDFSVPAFRIKRDVLPGRYETIWFEATSFPAKPFPSRALRVAARNSSSPSTLSAPQSTACSFGRIAASGVADHEQGFHSSRKADGGHRRWPLLELRGSALASALSADLSRGALSMTAGILRLLGACMLLLALLATEFFASCTPLHGMARFLLLVPAPLMVGVVTTCFMSLLRDGAPALMFWVAAALWLAILLGLALLDPLTRTMFPALQSAGATSRKVSE